MNPKEVNKTIGSKLRGDELIEVFRSGIDEMSMLTNALYVSQELLYCHNITDFSVDGYRVVRLSDITDIVTCDKNESLRFMNYIYKKENLFPKDYSILESKSWSAVCKYLAGAKKAATVECTFDDAIDYYVGWIESVNGNIATMKCFDGGGTLFEQNQRINLDFVSQIIFDDKYSRLMAKYIK